MKKNNNNKQNSEKRQELLKKLHEQKKFIKSCRLNGFNNDFQKQILRDSMKKDENKNTNINTIFDQMKDLPKNPRKMKKNLNKTKQLLSPEQLNSMNSSLISNALPSENKKMFQNFIQSAKNATSSNSETLTKKTIIEANYKTIYKSPDELSIEERKALPSLNSEKKFQLSFPNINFKEIVMKSIEDDVEKRHKKSNEVPITNETTNKQSNHSQLFQSLPKPIDLMKKKIKTNKEFHSNFNQFEPLPHPKDLIHDKDCKSFVFDHANRLKLLHLFNYLFEQKQHDEYIYSSLIGSTTSDEKKSDCKDTTSLRNSDFSKVAFDKIEFATFPPFIPNPNTTTIISENVNNTIQDQLKSSNIYFDKLTNIVYERKDNNIYQSSNISEQQSHFLHQFSFVKKWITSLLHKQYNYSTFHDKFLLLLSKLGIFIINMNKQTISFDENIKIIHFIIIGEAYASSSSSKNSSSADAAPLIPFATITCSIQK